jgi:uncharacterized membrane protein YkvA (DUF1232 family)
MDSQTVENLWVLLAIVLAVLMGVAIWLFVKLLMLRRQVGKDFMSRHGKIAFWVAAIYSISPIDVLPDPVYLDDIGVLVWAITYITGILKKRRSVGDQSRRSQLQPGRGSGRP